MAHTLLHWIQHLLEDLSLGRLESATAFLADSYDLLCLSACSVAVLTVARQWLWLH